MDGEVRIEGFSQENIKKCSAKFLESEDKSKEMLAQAQAKGSGVDKLLSVPIILLMACALFEKNQTLPNSRKEKGSKGQKRTYGTAQQCNVILQRFRTTELP